VSARELHRRRALGALGAALMPRALRAVASALGALAIQPPAASAQSGRIRLVIPFSAGATSDLLARPIMAALEKELGQNTCCLPACRTW
jgi:tripartite-type tricarboxylate transporter receptor subunit TctC